MQTILAILKQAGGWHHGLYLRIENLLNGIYEEVLGLLQTRKVSANIFAFLKKMKPLRQVEAAEHVMDHI